MKNRMSLFASNALYLLAAACLTVMYPVLALLYQLLPSGFSEALLSAYAPAYELGVLALPVVLYVRRRPDALPSLRLAPPRPSHLLYAAAAGLAGALASNYVGIFWCALLQRLGLTLSSASPAPDSLDALLSAFLVSGLLAASCEELFFRGAILGAWEQRGSLCAVLVSGLLFCALHGSIEGLPGQLMMGMALGWICVASGSVYAAMACHTVYNAVVLVLSFLSERSGTGENVADVTDIFAAMNEAGGAVLYALEALLLLALFAATLTLFLAPYLRERDAVRAPRLEIKPMDWREVTLLFVGVLTAVANYALSLVDMI